MKTDNELIAEFMGFKPYHDSRYGEMWPDPSRKDNPVVMAMLYEKSWDWLMPVVEKIATINPVQQVSVSTLKTRIWFSVSSKESFIEAQGKSMINKCYNTVVEFIKWYNQQSKCHK